jgi:hypothetical protein
MSENDCVCTHPWNDHEDDGQECLNGEHVDSEPCHAWMPYKVKLTFDRWLIQVRNARLKGWIER